MAINTTTTTDSNSKLLQELKKEVGVRHVANSKRILKRHCKGYRVGGGKALAVVFPGTLEQQWNCLKICLAADMIIIMQAANTSLTGGATPSGEYDREVIIINTKRLDQIHLLNDGKQFVSFAGATLFSLENKLSAVNRKPHSVIGSSCIGASIVGGICNNSGGALIERGPAYTELALYAQINRDGQLELVNDLGLELGNDPRTIFRNLQNGNYDKNKSIPLNAKASDTEYHLEVRKVDLDTPSRYNSNKKCLNGASGCAGKLAVFAVRLDSFEAYNSEATFYLGTNKPSVFTQLRRDMLTNFETLPVSAEYMHKDCYDVAKKYGKDTLFLLDKFGTHRLPAIYTTYSFLAAAFDSIPFLPKKFLEKTLQLLSKFIPNLLPSRVEEFREKFDHYLILKMRDEGIEKAHKYLRPAAESKDLDYFECNEREAVLAGLHRYAAAGAAVRFADVHADKVEGIISLDVALPRNETGWLEELPDHFARMIEKRLYYGHFFCHVFHQDYLVRKGKNMEAIKSEMLLNLRKRGAKYPAEHNVGHEYDAEVDLKNFYETCDPTNTLNPGVGGMSKRKYYA